METYKAVLIPKLVDFYEQGLFPFDKLIKYYDLEEINDAIAETESGKVLKAVVRMPSDV